MELIQGDMVAQQLALLPYSFRIPSLILSSVCAEILNIACNTHLCGGFSMFSPISYQTYTFRWTGYAKWSIGVNKTLEGWGISFTHA